MQTSESQNLLSIGKAAKFLGVSNDTLRRWEKKGLIKTQRSPSGRRYFEKAELEKIFAKGIPETTPKAQEIQEISSPMPEPPPPVAAIPPETPLPPSPVVQPSVSQPQKQTREGIFSTRNIILITLFVTSVYIILLLYFLVRPILFPQILSPIPLR